MIAEWEQQRSRVEREMTICIAASCQEKVRGRGQGGKIILCTDWRISGQLGGANTLHKQTHLRDSWWCLTAGNTEEINAVIPIIKHSFNSAGNVDETNVKILIEAALRKRLGQKRDALAYARYSKSYEEIYKSGREKLPEAQFVRFITETSMIDLDAEFIVAGFYNNDDFIFRTKRTGEAVPPTHFACAGEGSFLAHASLMRRSYSNVVEWTEALYLVYEAKKAAEAVNSVGDTTLLSILDENGVRTTLNQDDSPDFFQKLYAEYGPRPVPMHIDIPEELLRNE